MSAAAVTTPTTSTLRRRALGVGAAVASCLAIWSIGALAGVDYTVESPGQPATVIGAAAIVLVSLGAPCSAGRRWQCWSGSSHGRPVRSGSRWPSW
ncbi:DUF6069 family protein [Micromonospora tarensis]|uniref:Uncharacterized protein n=1 Tax=Micromonospora tarensis TaxID=2806100 RepID=A0ABS1YR28_9ACTN|nr:DUF6069 family protein [Micromonospora tarensis]MBM0279599.1 hypothetical protein [Micromonospora tarensis]